MLAAAGTMGVGASCDGSQKCNYHVDSVSDGRLKLTHSTRIFGFKDTIRFEFHGLDHAGNCVAHAHSTSQAPYALLDGGQNLCNIRNLLDESILNYELEVCVPVFLSLYLSTSAVTCLSISCL